MGDTRPPQDDYPQPRTGEAPVRHQLRPQTVATLTTARLRRLRTARLVRPARGRGDPPHTRRTVVEILLIDESPTDVDLFRRALRACALPYPLTVLRQWGEVTAFVRRAAASPPHGGTRLIIAEAWIPGMAVEELLAAVRAVPSYAAVPAVLFSALPPEEGRRLGAQAGAAGFVHKPSEWRAFVMAVATIVGRWGVGRAGPTLVPVAGGTN